MPTLKSQTLFESFSKEEIERKCEELWEKERKEMRDFLRPIIKEKLARQAGKQSDFEKRG